MNKLKRIATQGIALVGAVCIFGGVSAQSFKDVESGAFPSAAQGSVNKINAAINTNKEAYFDDSVVYKLPETLSDNQEVSVIVKMNADSLVDSYINSDSTGTVGQYVASKEAKKQAALIETKRRAAIQKLNHSGIDYELGVQYDTLLSGFEITVKAKDFSKVNQLLSADATLILGETYLPAEAEVVTNDVDVYETGIFNTSNSEYQGDGVVVAVLDSGLDYTHTAFSTDNFTSAKKALDLSKVSSKVASTSAAKFTAGLTGEDVYVSDKIPFAYDYADKDTDVLPTNSEHGTHVSGIIAGSDDRITGVAPNAQLAFMKVFSDGAQGAKDSWILAALEDCVELEVDVVNMSLGSGCGFTREIDNEQLAEAYDKIREAGISLIVSAGNSTNAAVGSEKNGNLGLTSNPDTGTVGSPSTYEASLSVASVDGVKTPYLNYKDEIIYFKEASTNSAKDKDFVDDILKTVGENVQSHDFEFVTIPGIGRSSDYPEAPEFYAGKIVLVKRGTTTFEDKVRVALKEMGAAGIIIYNNVSGSISMAVGEDVGAVCSISQDEGELLAADGTGIITINRNHVAGPFMSDFSAWGPTSDLLIKPEITAHGGQILSAIPGQGYDELSGTSMAAPNQSGATALIRQYVKYSGKFGDNLTAREVTAIVNQLMMSTADIVYNKNGLAYAVRKQGAGLVNINKAVTTESYLKTFDKDGNEMDRTKLELGDDKQKTGVYTMSFEIHNITSATASYDVSSIVMTEGVSKTYTSHGDRVVTQEGYLLDDSATTVKSVTGGTVNGNAVTVAANGTAKVTLEVVLSDAAKSYMDESFENGMYVEGFVTLANKGAGVNLNVPFLAFYGDWTKAPIFDEEYYDTNKDELNAGIDAEDKLMADSYATRAIGTLYTDYIAVLGAYYFQQDPSATPIAADKKYISISNQEDGTSSAINALRSISAGLLRNAKEVHVSIVEDATGREIFQTTDYDVGKSYSNGGNTIYAATVDVEFSALAHNLKNNTQYTVTMTSYIDYGSHDDQKNVRSTFEFPLFIDFQAPVITDVNFRSEYDKTTKKTSLFADLSVYDNHYAMGLQIGQVVENTDPTSQYKFNMESFGKYVTPVYSSFNSTSVVTIELTDYVAQLKNSAGLVYDENGNYKIDKNNNSFIVSCYDYAFNGATYEIRLPDEIMAMNFNQEEIKLSPNETLDISGVLDIYPSQSWLQTLDFTSSDSDVVEVVNQTILAKQSGTAQITATGYDKDGKPVSSTVNVKVYAEGEEGYVGGYSIPEVNKFELTQYYVNKAYYSVSSDEREIGLTGGTYEFDGSFNLSMFPSESVTLQHVLDSYFPERTGVVYTVGDSSVATVDQDGTIVAQAEGTTIVNVNVTFDGKYTFFSGSVSITVKDPFTTNSIYLMSYKGLGGEVVIPADRGFTTIYSYAFSNYNYVDKDLSAGDVIDKEDPYYIKQMYIGEDTITKIVIPEGVTTIESYAFAKLTALEEVVLPSTLKMIGVGAFLGCEKLKTINLEHVQFINENAFLQCAMEEVNLSSVVAINNYAFKDCPLTELTLPESAQSIGIGSFQNNAHMASLTLKAAKIKLGDRAFAGCEELLRVNVNAAVIPAYAFAGCSKLKTVRLGKDVSVIGEFAFYGTEVEKFEFITTNANLTLEEDGKLIYKGTELVLASPKYSGKKVGSSLNTLQTNATSIARGALAGNAKIYNVVANNVTSVGAYAFDSCTGLTSVTMDALTTIGDYAFYNTALTKTPKLDAVTSIGNYAFAGTKLTSVKIENGTTVGNYAFALNESLQEVTVGDNVKLGEGAFYCLLKTVAVTGNLSNYTRYDYYVKDDDGNVVARYDYYKYDASKGSALTDLTLGAGVTIGDYAFFGNVALETVAVGENTIIGDYAFYCAVSLNDVDVSKAISIGAYAFSGAAMNDLGVYDNQLSYAYEIELIDGVQTATGYVTSSFYPAFDSVDLTSATKLGDYAFANNGKLSAITFGAGLQEIPAYAFAGCTQLTAVTLPEQTTKLGDYAFAYTALQAIDVSKVDEIGNYAFAFTALTSATLKENVAIGDGAFAYCLQLATATNLDKATKIGAYAFEGVAMEELTLTNVEEIGDFAFALSKVNKVTFGTKLNTLGENPFYLCNIDSFGKEEELKFNGAVVGTQLVETYDVSETVKVIDGVLYQILPNGKLELVSYPLAKEQTKYTIEEGTVRISARAFAGSALQTVTLPTTLKAVGDKAFYGCATLITVVFQSYQAPTLEEEFSESYASDIRNVAVPGYMGTYKGLGISPFPMWNAASYSSNFYFGANFVNYIGRTPEYLVMVKPANGQNYDTFIMSQYFGTTVLGSNAATDETLAVIAMIAALPGRVTLNDEAAVVAARAAFDAITSYEQKALVTELGKLESAEATIKRLKLKEEENTGDKPGSSDEKDKGKGCKGCRSSADVSSLLICVAAVGTLFVCRKRKHD